MNPHGHAFAPAGHNRPPCPVCDSEADDEALIARLAADLWESRPGERLDYTPWVDVTDHWRDVFMAFARASLACMRKLD